MNTILLEVEEVELFGISIWKELSWTHLVDEDGQGYRKVAWPAEKNFTILEPKPTSYDLQDLTRLLLAFTQSDDNLFHLFIVLCKNKYFLISILH